jgi:hypothetical protein
VLIQKHVCFIDSGGIVIEDLEVMAKKLSLNSVSIGDWETLLHYAKNADVAVELGTNGGFTSIALSTVAKEVITCDVFEDIHLISDPEQRNNYKNHWEVNKTRFMGVVSKISKFAKNVSVFRSLSVDFADKFKDGIIDFCFVDADHSYIGVKNDYTAWLPKIREGGYIAFHDVGEGCEVLDFYNRELLNDNRIELMPDVATGKCCTKVFKKKG